MHNFIIILLYIEKLLVILRDGRKLIGILRSVDQFGKLMNVMAILLTCFQIVFFGVGIRSYRRKKEQKI